MIRKIYFILFIMFVLCLILGCHAKQERAWEEALATTRQKIAEDPKLSENVVRVELERRQFVRVYIKPQHAKINFQKITLEVGKIVGDALFSNPGNSMKEITIYGNLDGGDELIVCKYTKETGIVLEKDRTFHSM